MNLSEFKDYLAKLTWEEFKPMMEDNNYPFDLVDEADRNRALILFMRWYNENRDDDGFTDVVIGLGD